MKTIYIYNNDLNKRKIYKIAKKLNKINKKEDIVVALCKNLQYNYELNNKIKHYGIRILNGRWVFKFLIPEMIDYIAFKYSLKPEMINIAILINSFDEIVIKQIKQIAKIVKNFKIITKSRYQFLYLEDEMYKKYGIAIQVTDNKAKGLLNTDVLINYDFNQDLINKYTINPHAIIINIEEQVEIIDSHFLGKIINYFEIKFDEEKYDSTIDKNSFDRNILYEGYIFRRDTYDNIKKQMTCDNVRIQGFS